MKTWLKAVFVVTSATFLLAGCGVAPVPREDNGKTFIYATTGYGREMGDAGLNPHDNYSGWSAVRYGVGETLFKFSDIMEPEPWLATKYEYIDDKTVQITLREGVTFSSGRPLDGMAVKECLDDLIAHHDRARVDLDIDSIEAEGQTITIHTKTPCPTLIHDLCDPYGAIIDMQQGVKANSVAGTGPYVADTVTDTEIHLHKNETYWGSTPQVDHIIVKAMTDGNVMTTALQSGDVDATYGLPYDSYPLFADTDRYQIASCATSRTFFGQVNMKSAVMKDDNVRKAIVMAIDKKGFVDTLLQGHGEMAVGPFPKNLASSISSERDNTYQVEKAKQLLKEAGWEDTNGDGYVDKQGKNLTIRYLTYPGRMELPILAEAVQNNLKQIGIQVEVNCSADHLKILEKGDYDIYASALVTAPTGDPEYFFTTCALDASIKNRGFYHNDILEALAKELHETFEPAKRNQLAKEMQHIILDDNAFFFVSYLQMSILSRKGVKGLSPHPCDYYEITADLDVE